MQLLPRPCGRREALECGGVLLEEDDGDGCCGVGQSEREHGGGRTARTRLVVRATPRRGKGEGGEDVLRLLGGAADHRGVVFAQLPIAQARGLVKNRYVALCRKQFHYEIL